MLVKVSPFFNPWYYEYYYQGLVDYYKKENVQFCFDPQFVEFEKYSRSNFAASFFYYEIHNSSTIVRVIISGEDSNFLTGEISNKEEIYNKVDVFAKVNLVEDDLQKYPKLLPIGPGFGVNFFNLFDYLAHSWNIFVNTGHQNAYLKNYFQLSSKRCRLKEYETSRDPIAKYIFYLNYPWKKHSALTETRKKIISVLQAMEQKNKILFEGGFSKRRLGPFPGLENFSAKKRYSHKRYLDRMKHSEIAISIPAVHGSLGWKLGEYIALGKPIISLPLGRIMPGEFVNGVHYHLINNTEELEDAIDFLMENKDYRCFLSDNVKRYYTEFIKVDSVIRRIHNQGLLLMSQRGALKHEPVYEAKNPSPANI